MSQLMVVRRSGPLGLFVCAAEKEPEKERDSVTSRLQPMEEDLVRSPLFKRRNVLQSTVNVSGTK